jgi:Arc/MetJ-type ribon-helix-helix transcriptional regulator
MNQTQPSAETGYLDRPTTIRLSESTWQRMRKVLKGGEVRSAFVRAAVLAELEKREANERRRGAVL